MPNETTLSVFAAREAVLIKLPVEEVLFPTIPGVRMMTTGVVFEDDLDMESWGLLSHWSIATWTVLQRVLPFIVGDILAYGHLHFGDDYVQYVEVTNKAVNTLRKYQWVAERVPHYLRDEAIPFRVYTMVASDEYSLEEKKYWLDWYRNNPDSDALRLAMRPPVPFDEGPDDEVDNSVSKPLARTILSILKEMEYQLAQTDYAGLRQNIERLESYFEKG